MQAATTPLGYVVRLGRDVCFVGIGAIGLAYTPASVQHFTDRAHLVAVVWAALFLAGGLAGIWGAFREHPLLELWGGGFVVAAFVLWIIAALTTGLTAPGSLRPLAPPTSADQMWSTIQVVLVFVGAIFGQIYRAFIIANGVLGR